MKAIIILGSARRNGDTQALVHQFIQITQWDLVNLSDYNISHYDYTHKNRQDDYIPLMKRLIEQYDLFIFATPVYWYAMSGIMKVFFDRFSNYRKKIR